MKNVFSAVKLSDRLYWVGAVDWAIRDFHGYATKRGTTYNAYLVLGERIALIDTVKKAFHEEMMSRISSVVDPERIDILVSNHAEMDHTGCLPETVAALKPAKLLASDQGVKALTAHFGPIPNLAAVKDGDRLELGGATLRFLETRMLHWPDSMFTLLEEEQILFSQDAFGMHLASGERFADELPDDLLREEAARYYGNILLPYSNLVQKLIEKAAAARWEFSVIAPDHGPIWRRDPGKIVQLYAHWAQMQPTRKALVVYDTMWGSTDLMARAIGDGLEKGGAVPRLMPLSGCHRSDVATEILEAGALLVGSPTLNNQLFPTVADILAYLKGLKRKNLVGTAFGSYGWSGKTIHQINDALKEMGVNVLGEGIQVQYVPRPEDLEKCCALGREVAGRLNG